MKVNSYVPDFNEQSSRSGSVDIKIVSRSMGLLMYFEAALLLYMPFSSFLILISGTDSRLLDN